MRILRSEERAPHLALRHVFNHHQPQPFDIVSLARHTDGRKHRRTRLRGEVRDDYSNGV